MAKPGHANDIEARQVQHQRLRLGYAYVAG